MYRSRNGAKMLLRGAALSVGKRMPEMLLGLLFLLGVLIGSLMYRYMDERMRAVLRLISQSGAGRENGPTLSALFFSDSILLAAVFFCGFCAIAQPVILVIPVFKGLGNGLVLGNLYALYGFGAVPYICIKLLPHYLVCTIIIILACRDAYFLSRNISGHIRGNAGQPMRITGYILRFFIYLTVIFIICVADTFLISGLPVTLI